MTEAQKWASDYFSRLEELINELNCHPLINHVLLNKREGLSEFEITEIEKKIDIDLRFNSDFNKVDLDNSLSFSLNDYIREFYKISNGLNLAWDSHIAESNLGTKKLGDSQADIDVGVPEDNGEHFGEGYLALLPLDSFTSGGNAKYGLLGDPSNSRTGEKISNEGGILTYLDGFSWYNDICIELNYNPHHQLYFGEDYSAFYDESRHTDFVLYMEYLLVSYFSVLRRKKGFYENSASILQSYKNNYENVSELVRELNFISLDQLLKWQYEEEINEYATLENFNSKPREIYNQIESLLGISIKDEYE